jgi:hypothetical protein
LARITTNRVYRSKGFVFLDIEVIESTEKCEWCKFLAEGRQMSNPDSYRLMLWEWDSMLRAWKMPVPNGLTAQILGLELTTGDPVPETDWQAMRAEPGFQIKWKAQSEAPERAIVSVRFELQKKSGWKVSAAQATIIAAFVAALGGFVGSEFNVRTAKSTEDLKDLYQFAITDTGCSDKGIAGETVKSCLHDHKGVIDQLDNCTHSLGDWQMRFRNECQNKPPEPHQRKNH